MPEFQGGLGYAYFRDGDCNEPSGGLKVKDEAVYRQTHASICGKQFNLDSWRVMTVYHEVHLWMYVSFPLL